MRWYVPQGGSLRREWVLVLGLSVSLALGAVPTVAASRKGEAYLIVYPDYPVDTDTLYGYTTLVGHAGVLLVSEKGATKYFEFGRYDPEGRGRVLQRTIPGAAIESGTSSEPTLAAVMGSLSKQCGKSGRIRAAKFIAMDFEAMQKYAVSRRDASDPTNPIYDKERAAYDIVKNNCAHFAERVVLQGNDKIDRPLILLYTPLNLVTEYLEEKNAEVLWDPKSSKLTVGRGDEKEAKRP